MKRFACALLAGLLVFCLAAEAEEQWETWESEAGIRLSYDAQVFGLDDSSSEKAYLYPRALYSELTEPDTHGRYFAWRDPLHQAVLTIGDPLPVDRDWVPQAAFAPLEDHLADAGHPCWLWRHEIQDEILGTYVDDEIVVRLINEICILHIDYPQGDPDGWGEMLWDALESIEFPPQPAEAGSFRLDFFQGGAAGMRFADVIVDEEAEPVVLLPLKETSRFVLEYLTWYEDAFTVSTARVLWAADTLPPGENLRIFCYFPDILPVLRIRCINESGEEECWYLFQSGRDGSLELLEDAEGF